MNDEKNDANLNGEISTVPSVPIYVGIMEEEAKSEQQQSNENENENEYPAAKAPPLYPVALSVVPIPVAADCQPHLDDQQQRRNIHAVNEQRNFSAAADGQPQQRIYSIPLANAVPNAGAVGEIMPPPTLRQQNMVYAAPIISNGLYPMQPKQFEVPSQQQSMQIINMTNMVAGVNANCVHKFETVADGCGVLCICLLVILLFPIGLIFLLCIPFAMKKRCTKCGFEC